MSSFTNPVLSGEVSLRINLLHKVLKLLGFPVSAEEEKAYKAGETTLQQVRALQAKLNIRYDERYVLDAITYEAMKAELIKEGHLARPATFTVKGAVYSRTGEKVRQQQLIAVDVDLHGAAVYRSLKSVQEIIENGGFEFLGEKQSDVHGNYYVEFFSFQFEQAERKKADVVVFAVNSEGEILGRSRMVKFEEYSGEGVVSNLHVLITKTDERTEYDILMSKLLPFLQESNVTLAALGTSSDQVKFTSDELDEREIKIKVAVAAEGLRTERNENLSHELLYGIGRQNILLNWLALYRNTDNELRLAIKRSIESGIIKTFDESAITAFLQLIHEYATAYTLQYSNENKRASLEKILSAALPAREQREAFVTAYRAFKNQATADEGVDYKRFWSDYLPNITVFKENPALIPALLLTQQLTIISSNHPPLMEELQVARKIASVTALIEFDDEEWKAIITKTGVPPYIRAGNTADGIAEYATQIQSFLHAAYPTQKVAAMLKKKELPVADENVLNGITTFLTNNESFDISQSRIHQFENEIKTAAPEHFENVKKELKRMQRVFQISPTPTVMGLLMKNELDSAFSISGMSKKSFIRSYSSELGGEVMADAVHQRAEHIGTMTAERAMKITEGMYLTAPAYAFSQVDKLNFQTVLSNALPNYTDLFGSPDICECEHCRSVYSAAAYFVDLLRFLKSGVKNADNKSPLRMFEERRPDLLHLPLTCENTNTLIPYIDLVNEVMEFYTYHGFLNKDAAKNTGNTTAEELRANPQNIEPEAYRLLKNRVYPFSLPYHQPLDVIRTYSDHLKTERYDIMKGLQVDFSAAAMRAIESEVLRISEEEYIVLTGKKFDGTDDTKALHEYYGYATAAELNKMAGTGVSDGIHEFLRRSGMKYAELTELIKTKFINPHQHTLDFLEDLFADSPLGPSLIYNKLQQINTGALNPANDPEIMSAISGKISPADFAAWVQQYFEKFNTVITLYQSESMCDLNTTSLKTLQNVYAGSAANGITLPTWVKIHRFIRLWKKLCLKIHEVDLLLSVLMQDNITPLTITHLSYVVLLNKQLKLPINKLATLWGSIDTYGEKSLYKKLFLNKAVQKIDTAFEPDAFGNYLSDPTKLLKDHIPAILAAFRMSEEDVSAITGVARVMDNDVERALNLDTDTLNIYNLSIIYRYTVLSKALKLKVVDCCLLTQLFNASPFSKLTIPAPANPPVDPFFDEISPAATFEFAELATSIKKAGFKSEVLQYIFTGTLPVDSKLALDIDSVKQTCRNIRQAFATIAQEHITDPAFPLTPDIIRSKLSHTFQQETITRMMSIIDGTAVFTAITDANLFITIPDNLASKYSYIRASGRLTSNGIMIASERDALKAIPGVNPNFQNAVDAIYKMPEDFMISTFSGVFTDMNTAMAVLLNHPEQPSVPEMDAKLKLVYTAFLPVLKKKLYEDAIIQHIASLIGLSQEATQVLLKNELPSIIDAIVPEGFSAAYFPNATFSAPAAVTRIDKTIDFDWAATAPAIAVPADNFSVRWQGFLTSPSSGEYTLIVDVKESDEAFNLYLDDALIVQKPAANITLSWEVLVQLNASQMHKLVVEYVESTGNAGISLSWKTATTAAEIIKPAALFPAQVVANFITTAQTYHRAAKFITGFSLTDKEVYHFVNYKIDFDSIDFKALTPVHWKRINDYVTLRNLIPQSQSLLTDVFVAANISNPVPTVDSLINILSLATAWDVATLSYLINTYFGFSVNDFKNEMALSKIYKAISFVQKTGLSANTLAIWAVPATDFDELDSTADMVKSTVKAKYEEEDWLELAGNLSDTIRENQKQALISYLLTKQELIDWGAKDADGLFEYFLIDVQMGACMDTSRIVQANAAVQMFVNRCLLNMESDKRTGVEKGVAPEAIDKDRWEWMKYYRVWEVNRKIFLYPENWLEPEWRDDRSPFFKELESELVQNDISDRSVETAFRNYLAKLNTVANLDVCGVYQENYATGEKMKLLHVFGRTHNSPYQFFYRTCNEFYKWSAWEKVQLDIRMTENGNTSGVHLLPVVWKNRLFVFWVEFVEKQEEQSAINKDGFEASFDGIMGAAPSMLKPKKYWELLLGWSENIDGKWNPKQLSKEFIKVYSETSGESKTDPINSIYVYSLQYNNALYLVPTIKKENKGVWVGKGHFALTDIQAPVVTNNQATGTGIDYESAYRYDNNFEKQKANAQLEFWGNTYLQNTNAHNIVFSNNILEKESNSKAPFFYHDSMRSYFVRRADFKVWDEVKRPEWHNPGIVDIVDDSYFTQPHVPSVGPEDYMPGTEVIVTGEILGSVQNILMSGSTGGMNMPVNTTRTPIMNRINEEMVPYANKLSMENGFKMTDMAALDHSFSGLTEIATQFRVAFHWEKGLEFHTFYHPYSSEFVSNLNKDGIKGLMDSDTMLNASQQTYYNDKGETFKNNYDPKFPEYVKKAPVSNDYKAGAAYTYYKENVCFDVYGANSIYNWELFFHAPLYIATRLSRNGKYEEAMKWFHYIFDPTTDEMPLAGQTETARYWKTLPFKTTPSESLEEWFMSLTPNSNPSNENAIIAEWRKNPFKPFIVARNRPIAFMKNVVIKYVENLRLWGDSLFRLFTRESVNESLQLYVMASHILGPRPQFVPKRGEIKAETYDSLKNKWDDFSNALVELENIFPFSSEVPIAQGNAGPGLLGIGKALYFCIPSNEKLMEHWDTIEDRLYKIRHCMDIDGVERQLALFSPPIDPAMLINAAAQGLSLGSILSDLSSPPPIYRFNFLMQKANEFCAEVKSLGGNLLAVLEKKDTEELGKLRASHETAMVELMTAIKERQVLDAKVNKEALVRSRKTAEFRLKHYNGLLTEKPIEIPASPQIGAELNADSQLPANIQMAEIKSDVDDALVDSGEAGVKIISKEKEDLDLSLAAKWMTSAASVGEGIAGSMRLIPQFDAAGEPMGVGVCTDFGGVQLGGIASAIANAMHTFGQFQSMEAAAAQKMAGYIRREQEWTLQANLAIKEIIQLDKQITSADIRIQMAEKELFNHKQQIEHTKQVELFLKDKFTNQELYQWMKEQLFFVYKQSYNMAYDMAKKVEKCYRYETGNEITSFISYGYWDNQMQGLCAGEKLQLALRQMEKSYLEENKRELELKKNVSLALINPLALQQLRQTGKCTVSIPEELFDMDFQGHYFRRIKAVSMSIPCIAGPFTTISCTLRLLKNTIRTNKSMNSDGNYEHMHDEGILIDDDRFRSSNVPVQSIAITTGQSDPGMFELNFRDERYLPFEGAGAISEWKIELTTDEALRQFDYSTISDIIIHLNYTAREDAGLFKEKAVDHIKGFLINVAELTKQPLMRMFSMRHEFSTEWHRFLHPPVAGDDQVMKVTFRREHFPFFTRERNLDIRKVEILAKTSRTGDYHLMLTATGTENEVMESAEISMPESLTYGDMQKATLSESAADITVEDIHIFSELTMKLKHNSDSNYHSLDDAEMEDLFVVVHYKLSDPI
jgi:hypothetical protein